MQSWLMRLIGVVIALALAGATPARAEPPGAVSVRLPGAAAPTRLYGRSYALVIGMDDYTGGWPKLRNAINDAVAIAETLEAQGFSVRLEKNLPADKLELAFKEFFNFAGVDAEPDEDIRLLVWFAGHGHSLARADGGPLSGYIVGADAPSPAKTDPRARRQAEADFKSRSVSLIRFGEHLRESFAKHVLVVFDSCFSGNVFSIVRAGGLPPTITRATTLPVRQFVTSGDRGQYVTDDGLFRRLFINAITGEEPAADQNSDGYVTASELGLFLHQKMTNLTRSKQTPLFGTLREEGLDRGDFVFKIPGADPAADLAPAGPALEEQFWLFIKQQSDAKLVDSYLKAFPGSTYRVAAEQHLKLMRGETTEPAWHTVPVFFGTDRRQEAPTARPSGSPGPQVEPPQALSRLSFGAERARALSLGQVLVTVPTSRASGQIERPYAVRIPYFQFKLTEQQEDPSLHFTVREIRTTSAAEFTKSVSETVAKSERTKDAALVFVHGYNTSFENAIFRAAQVAYDTGFDGPVAAYSWPSGSNVSSYTYDRDSVEAAAPHFAEFLDHIGRQTGAKTLHIVSHGMGSVLVLRTLRDRQTTADATGAKIGQVIFAAPDVDRDAFVNACEQMRPSVEGITVYAAANDRALQVSRKFFGGAPRAGDVAENGPIVSACADTIDVTAASTDALALNHSGYAENNTLLSDLSALLGGGSKPPNNRWPALETINTPEGTYWRYPGVRPAPATP